VKKKFPVQSDKCPERLWNIILGDILILTRHSPEQSDLTLKLALVWARGWTRGLSNLTAKLALVWGVGLEVLSNLNYSMIPWAMMDGFR